MTERGKVMSITTSITQGQASNIDKTGVNAWLAPIIRNAGKYNAPVEGDYIQGDLLYCGNCKTPKQTKIFVNGIEQIVPCMCKCKTEARDKEEAAYYAEQRKVYIDSLPAGVLQDESISEMTFENDDTNSSQIKFARKYVDAWEDVKKENAGMLNWGDTGNGKTYTAACIANALMEKGVPVLFTSTVKLLAEVDSMYKAERNKLIRSLDNYDLLVLDDMGAERDTGYAREHLYHVIDNRYKLKKPLIVTTNMQLGVMQKEKNMEYKRIYERVQAMCTPIQFRGENRRKGEAESKVDIMRDMFRGN